MSPMKVLPKIQGTRFGTYKLGMCIAKFNLSRESPALVGQRRFCQRYGAYFRPKHKKISSPSPREFGPKDAAIESSVDRIHEERGLGGEEQ